MSITIFRYIDEVFNAFYKVGPKGKGVKSSTAPNNLFVVNKDCKKLDQEKVVGFHNLVVKALYATKMARPGTFISIKFLTTTVRSPNTEYWAKLVHLFQYIRGTHKLFLTLSANGSGILKCWVNASFSVHLNMQVHSGGGLSLGRVFPIVVSTKQNLNTKISMDTEIAGVDDFTPAICWNLYFITA